MPAEALRPERENYGPQSLNTPQSELGKKVAPEKADITVNFDADVDALLAELNLVDESVVKGELANADIQLEDAEKKREEYHTAASKVYEIANKFERDLNPMGDEDRDKLATIRSWLPRFVGDEEKVSSAASASVAKLERVKGQTSDATAIGRIEAKISELNTEVANAADRQRQHRVFGRYIDMLFAENNERIAGRGKGGVKLSEAKTDEKDGNKKVEVSPGFDGETFEDELVKGGLKELGELKGLATLFTESSVTLDPKYTDQNMLQRSASGSPDYFVPQISTTIDKINGDLTKLKTLRDRLNDRATMFKFYTDPAQATIRQEYINVILSKRLDALQTALDAAKKPFEDRRDELLQKEWNDDVHPEFNKLQSATDRVVRDADGFTNVQQFLNLRSEIESATSMIDVAAIRSKLTNKNMSPAAIQSVIDTLQTQYLDKAKEAVRILNEKLLKHWKDNLNTPATSPESSALIKLQEEKVKKARKTSKEDMDLRQRIVDGRAALQRKKTDYLAAFLNTAVYDQAEAEFDGRLATAEEDARQLIESAKSKVDGDLRKDARLKPVIDAIAGASNATVPHRDREKAIVDALTALDKNVILSDFPPELQDQVKEDLRKIEEKAEEARAKVEKERLEKGASSLEAGTAGLQSAVDAIIKLKVPIKDDGTEDIKLEELEVYEKALEDAETALGGLNPPVAIEKADERYPRAKEKLDGLIERAKIREYTLDQCINMFIGTNTDVFLSANEMKSVTDLKEKQLILQFQGLYYKATSLVVEYVKDPVTGKDTKVVDVVATKEAQRRHRKLKTKIWAYRYQDENWGRQYIPAASPDKLYQGEAGMMTRRKLFREDFVEGVFEDPKYGRQSKKILEYAIDIVADEVAPKDATGKEIAGKSAYDLGLHYDSLKGDADGWVVLKNHLHDVFMGVDDKGNPIVDKDKEEQFGILWDLYVSFDLASISLTKLQKGTKTRSHNQGTTADAQAFRTRPFGILSHKRNRYTNLDEAKQHLLGLTGEWPKLKKMQDEVELDPVTLEEIEDPLTKKLKVRRVLKHVWAGNVHELPDGTHVRDTKTTQKLLRLQMEAYFPTKGIAGEIYSEEDLDEFIKQKQKEIAAEQTEVLREEARRKGANPALILDVDPHSIIIDREEARSQMWDQSVLPDHFDFLTKPTKEIGNQVLYETAQKGMDTMLDMMIRDLPILDEHAIFNANNGLYSEFINSGVGLAKLVKGNHIKMIVPMLRMFVARVGMRYEDDTLPGRRELKKKFVEQLGLSLQPKGGLDVDSSINGELRRFIQELNKGGGKGVWKDVPEILCPWIGGMRQPERIAYMKEWYHDKTGEEAPAELDAKRLNWGNDPDIQLYYDAIYERVPLPDIIDRSANSKETGEKKDGH